ncbi:hypothetical protein EDEG_00068 [Edhazardia aedis USNM 41457]|uniref:DDT domain-containing protein n=1 Tax=Edhazardia aedis (strain USNM 41457) TaxID=1003232 RepID=J9DB05_EDHAE|nr:hypothetical protein EDEG_00068 [Edhazardia aedis USNM 41457]|eukprot:EJW04951.1 hypothetical protein EDEG_00068 [Edhazardia aedis USNM 41457]
MYDDAEKSEFLVNIPKSVSCLRSSIQEKVDSKYEVSNYLDLIDISNNSFIVGKLLEKYHNNNDCSNKKTLQLIIQNFYANYNKFSENDFEKKRNLRDITKKEHETIKTENSNQDIHQNKAIRGDNNQKFNKYPEIWDLNVDGTKIITTRCLNKSDIITFDSSDYKQKIFNDHKINEKHFEQDILNKRKQSGLSTKKDIKFDNERFLLQKGLTNIKKTFEDPYAGMAPLNSESKKLNNKNRKFPKSSEFIQEDTEKYFKRIKTDTDSQYTSEKGANSGKVSKLENVFEQSYYNDDNSTIECYPNGFKKNGLLKSNSIIRNLNIKNYLSNNKKISNNNNTTVPIHFRNTCKQIPDNCSKNTEKSTVMNQKIPIYNNIQLKSDYFEDTKFTEKFSIGKKISFSGLDSVEIELIFRIFCFVDYFSSYLKIENINFEELIENLRSKNYNTTYIAHLHIKLMNLLFEEILKCKEDFLSDCCSISLSNEDFSIFFSSFRPDFFAEKNQDKSKIRCFLVNKTSDFFAKKISLKQWKNTLVCFFTRIAENFSIKISDLINEALDFSNQSISGNIDNKSFEIPNNLKKEDNLKCFTDERKFDKLDETELIKNNSENHNENVFIEAFNNEINKKTVISVPCDRIKHRATILLYMIDMVIQTKGFKKHIESIVDMVKQKEKSKFELNSSIRKKTLEYKNCQKDDEIAKIRSDICNLDSQMHDVDKWLVTNRFRGSIGSIDSWDFFYLNKNLYYKNNKEIYIIDSTNYDNLIRKLRYKFTKENVYVINVIKALKNETSIKEQT